MLSDAVKSDTSCYGKAVVAGSSPACPLTEDRSSVGRAPKDTGFDILTHSFAKDILMKQTIRLLQTANSLMKKIYIFLRMELLPWS